MGKSLKIIMPNTAFVNRKENNMKTKLNQSKLKLAIVSAMLLGTAGLTAPAYADAEKAMEVKASIGLACLIETTELNFGPYDAIVTNKTAALNSTGVTISSTCTAGSSGIIKLSDGLHPDGAQRRMVHATNNAKFLNYNVSGIGFGGTKWDTTAGVAYAGTGAKVSLPVYGQVPPAQGSAINGTYSDTLTALITY